MIRSTRFTTTSTLAAALLLLSTGCLRARAERNASPPPSSAPAPGAEPAPQAAPAPAPPPAPVYAGTLVEVPSGSRLVFSLDEAIDSSRMGAGQRFRATLDAALLDSAGQVVVAKGTKLLGVIVEAKQAGRVAGHSEIELAFTDLEIGGQLFPIQSQGVQAVGEGSGKDTARKVAAGALIGAAVGGKNSAAKGAAVGGAAAILTRGSKINIPAGTMLELALVAPAKVPAPVAAVAPAPAAAPVAAAPVAAAAPAAAVAPAAAPPVEDEKTCVKKLMASGFSSDEALETCKKK